MDNNIECEICGGTNFFKEHGYFFCNECQTQSQQIREHVFQDEVINLKGIRKIKKDKPENLDNKITSWECYNIVMCSLTDQIINIGADKNLKSIVKCLWMKYLQKLEVINLKNDVKPKLQLINSKRDSDILYGARSKKRKRKKSSDESSVSTTVSRRERSKKKRALVEAHYEEFSQKSSHDRSSLHCASLASLTSHSDKSFVSAEKLSFNKYSSKELTKKTSKYHRNKHMLDTASELQCHTFSYRNCSSQFAKGIHFLSPVKLYSILYLGLLINRDKIQLSDLLRFIREGHLTFNNYTEIFPEEYKSKFLNIQNNSKNSLFKNSSFRKISAEMAHFLDVCKYIDVIDIVTLSKRFCLELNLPDDIYKAVINIISKSNPKLTFTDKSKTIPNYEARIMSIIIFTLKLLFGLDGRTELEISKYAQRVNLLNGDLSKMFDIIKWMEYIGYRNVLISEKHFPSKFMRNFEDVDSDLFLRYIKSQEIKPDEDTRISKEMEGYKDLLIKIQQIQNDDVSEKVAPSLTPYLDYFQKLDISKRNISFYNFQGSSLDFLLRPNGYLDLVSSSWRIKHGGANDDWIIEEIPSCRSRKVEGPNDLKLIPVEITIGGNEKDIDETVCQNKISKNISEPQIVQNTYQKYRNHIFQKNKLYVKRISKEVTLDGTVAKRSKKFKIHYNPYERYWLHSKMYIKELCKTDFDIYLNKHPSSFKLIANECARIIEQNPQELLNEFNFSELYLVYCATYYEKNEKENKQKLLHSRLRHCINRSTFFW